MNFSSSRRVLGDLKSLVSLLGQKKIKIYKCKKDTRKYVKVPEFVDDLRVLYVCFVLVSGLER